LYGIIGNMPLTIGIANTWIVLLVAFIALVEFRPVEVVQSQVRPAFDPDLEAVLQARAGHAAPAPRRRPSLDPAAGAQS